MNNLTHAIITWIHKLYSRVECLNIKMMYLLMTKLVLPRPG